MLVSLGVENFRSFKNKTNIELKPITVLVGKNSCGKSSFLRLFPLFRQSVEANVMGPILWFGRYVDFGDFNNVLFKDSQEKVIKFYFDFKFIPNKKTSYYDFLGNQILNVNKTKNIEIELLIEPDGQKTKYKAIHLFFNNIKVFITNTKDGINYRLQDYDNQIIEHNYPNYFLGKTNNSSIFPFIKKNLSSENRSSILSNSDIFDDFYLSSHMMIRIDLFDFAAEKLKNHCAPQTNKTSLYDKLNQLKLDDLDKKSLFDYLKISFKEQKTFIKNLESDYDKIYKDTFSSIILASLSSLIEKINENLNQTFSKIRYIAPIRATAERFYRFQDLQINEMDHTGSNVAMILNSLSKKDRVSFATWVKNNFNFSVSVEDSSAHYAINITDEDGVKYNISDMGFGYSQLLPIMMSLWLETEKKEPRMNNELFFVIEQPELHLHPAYQTKLALLFSNIIAKASRCNIKIIVETHSQYFINALGESVEKKLISKDDVSIIIFNKKNKETDVQTAYFDEDGTLENWPIGFFSGE